MKNITLIGMAGSGKSVLGKSLAKKLGYKFVDVDQIIESSGKKLQEIINKQGEKAFLKIEEKTILSLRGNKKIFSPGGSCVLSTKAMNHLKKISLIIFIDVNFSIIKKRLEKICFDKRGIIGLKKKSLKEIYTFRKHLYKKYSHLTIKLNERPYKENINLLIKKLKKHLKAE